MCKSPFAYGGPSCSVNAFPPFSQSFSYTELSVQNFWIFGSVFTAPARCGKLVSGKRTVPRYLSSSATTSGASVAAAARRTVRRLVTGRSAAHRRARHSMMAAALLICGTATAAFYARRAATARVAKKLEPTRTPTRVSVRMHCYAPPPALVHHQLWACSRVIGRWSESSRGCRMDGSLAHEVWVDF